MTCGSFVIRSRAIQYCNDAKAIILTPTYVSFAFFTHLYQDFFLQLSVAICRITCGRSRPGEEIGSEIPTVSTCYTSDAVSGDYFLSD